MEYLEKLLKLRQDIKDGNATWQDVANYRSSQGKGILTADSTRRSFQIADEFIDAESISLDKRTYMSSNGINNDGSLFSDKIIEIRDCNKDSADALLEAHGFNSNNYILVNAKNSYWNIGSDGKSLYSSKITVKPKNKSDITFTDIDNYFSNFSFSPPVMEKVEGHGPSNEDGYILEVDLEDLHIGLLSYEPETGANYDINIAKKLITDKINEIYYKAMNHNIKKIVFACLGDILHINNEQNTTLKGTKQDVDSRLSKIFDSTLDMMILAISQLSLIAPVDVYSVVGNHDATVNYMVFRSVEMAFRNNPKIKFFNSPNPRKYARYGNVLLGWCHGDMPEKNMSDWLHTEAASDWGNSKYREVHCGHLHSIQTLVKAETEKGGVIIRHLPALCSSSAWEHYQGYSASLSTLVCFLWNENTGLQEIWYNNVNY